MNSTVITKRYSAPEVSKKEILRYMGCRVTDDETVSLIDKALELCLDKVRYDVCYAEFPINIGESSVDLGFCVTESRDAKKCLDGCESIILFAATAGLELDRLIMRYGKLSPALALSIQAIGAERIEALCDVFCRDMSEKFSRQGKELRPRFSAGYGDLPLEIQTNAFDALSCQSKIGLTLNKSLMMSPTKSVTAIIGIKNKI